MAGHRIRWALAAGAALLVSGRACAAANHCAALKAEPGAGVLSADDRPAGPLPAPASHAAPYPVGTQLPAHCEVVGELDRRIGVGGQHYAIRYHLRLPDRWNGRFLFQGGGGTNGVVGDALGPVGTGQVPALARGYAVVSQDSGHDNDRNNDPAHGGETVFGTDPQARADYGGTSLKRVADVAKGLVARFYGRVADHNYFFGCSKGGQEGMVFAQRYPDAFDGIVAMAPGFALPRAALAQTSDVQTFAPLGEAAGGGGPPFLSLTRAFSDAQLALVRRAVLAACDADDGLADGMVGRPDRCTTARVMPQLAKVVCRPVATQPCLTPVQVAALTRSLGGPRDSQGHRLYATWPWDAGIGAPGWRLWKLGTAEMPALNLLTGGPALATIFTVPPTPIHADPQSYFTYEQAFDFARDADAIYATNATFPRSAWTDISARSPDVQAFAAHGGKLIVPHGGSDPVFSLNDTLAWAGEVKARDGRADGYLRVFPVPGMNHCAGGPATDRFDALAALVAWVEQARAPNRIEASAGPETPWPGRTRPLCPWPKVATYRGKGSVEDGRNFICR